jgi:hypothetical protein
LSDLLRWLDCGGWCYWHTAPKHPRVIENMALSTLKAAIRCGVLRPAIERNPDLSLPF